MHQNPELVRLIHKNFLRVVYFAYGTPRIYEVIDKQFRGYWKSLEKGIRTISELEADRALLELATHLRILDDGEQLSEWHKETGSLSLGVVTKSDGSEEELFFRDFTNKVIHAASFEWHLKDDPPVIVCIGTNPDRWKSARIDITRLMFYTGQLAL